MKLGGMRTSRPARAFSLPRRRGEGGRRPDEGWGRLRRRTQPLTPTLSPPPRKGEGARARRLFVLFVQVASSASVGRRDFHAFSVRFCIHTSIGRSEPPFEPMDGRRQPSFVNFHSTATPPQSVAKQAVGSHILALHGDGLKYFNHLPAVGTGAAIFRLKPKSKLRERFSQSPDRTNKTTQQTHENPKQ